eukprot:jgi/Galph1/1066/GphlegSOOS_G5744.1
MEGHHDSEEEAAVVNENKLSGVVGTDSLPVKPSSTEETLSALTYLKDDIRSRHRPLVLVCATAAADLIAQEVLRRSNLVGDDCAALLNYLSSVQNTPVKISHPKRQQPLTLEDFKVRFVSLKDLCVFEGKNLMESFGLENHLAVATESPEESFRPMSENHEKLGRKLSRREPEWYLTYIELLDSLLVTSEYHSFGQPVAVVAIGWVGEGEQLSRNIDQTLPRGSDISSLYAKEILELDVPYCYVLIERDNIDSFYSSKSLIHLRKIYGPTVGQVLYLPQFTVPGLHDFISTAWNTVAHEIDNKDEIVNSGSLGEDYQPFLWNINSLGSQPLIASLLNEILNNFIGVTLQQRLLTLYRLVERLRRGVRNQLKALFRTERGPREGVVGGGLHSPLTYLSFSTESRVRQLADILFMIGDFEEAIEYYRLVSHDFKTDQSYPHLAKVEEMISLSLIMLDGPRKEILRHFNNAIENFLFAKVSNEVTRTCLYLSDYSLAVELKEDVSATILKVCSIVSLPSQYKNVHIRAAVLYERAAACYLSNKKWRRYGFQLVRAGFRFRQARTCRQAIRAYSEAYRIYQALGWTRIESHLCTTLGHIYLQLGDLEHAFAYFSRLDVFVKERFDKQVSHFLDLLNTSYSLQQTKLECAKNTTICFPKILDARTFIETVDFPAAASVEKDDLAWNRLEQTVVEYAERWEKTFDKEVVKANSPPSPRRRRQRMKRLMMTPLSQKEAWKQPVPCIVGEPLFLTLEIENPFQVPLLLSHIDIFYQFVKRGEKQSFAQLHTRQEDEQYRFLKLSETCLEILPNAIQQVRIELMVSYEGFVSIQGISWRFQLKYDSLVEQIVDSMTSSSSTKTVFDPQAFCISKHFFHIKGPRINETKEQRTSKEPIYEKNHSLELIAFGPSPSLKCTFLDAPLSVYHGQVTQAIIELKNCGQLALDSIFFHIDSFCWFTLDDPHEGAKHSISYPGNLMLHLNSNQSVKLKCYLRAAELAAVPRSGLPKTYRLVFCIQVGKDRATHRWRTCRCPWNVHILPSILHYPRFLRVSKQMSSTYLVGVEMEHADPNNPGKFSIRSLGILSKGQYHAYSLEELTAFNHSSSRQVFDMGNNETATCFVYVTKLDEKIATLDKISMVHLSQQVETSSKQDDFSLEISFANEYIRQRAIPSDKIVIFLCWAMDDQTRGILFDESISLVRATSGSDESQSIIPIKEKSESNETLPVRCQLEFEPTIHYDFLNNMQPVIVPVSVVFYNNCSDKPIDVHVRALPASIAEASRGRRWRGHVTANMLSILPQTKRIIKLAAIFPREGTYDASEISVMYSNKTVSFEGNNMINIVNLASTDANQKTDI